jgi:putative ABC transport system permease protein
MLKNWFKVAYRNLIRNKVFSIINISGLAFGMAACILISLYILDELSYDRYHEHADRIYRVSREFLNDDGVTNLHLICIWDRWHLRSGHCWMVILKELLNIR